jgi:hypothetical protein
VKFGDRLALGIPGHDLEIAVTLATIGQHQSVACGIVDQLALVASKFKRAVERFAALLLVAVQVSIELIEDQILILKDLSANVLDAIHGSTSKKAPVPIFGLVADVSQSRPFGLLPNARGNAASNNPVNNQPEY